MALKDVLVYLDQSEHAFRRLRLTADLARRHQSRLAALYVKELSPSQRHQQSISELGQGSAQAISRTNREIRHSIDEASERLQSALEEIRREYELEVEWRCLEGVGSKIVPQHARFSDLCVLSQDVSGAASDTGYTFSEELLFVAGRPVIFVPVRGSFKTLGQHILVAWNSSRAATRAVNDALPLIERAQQVTVLAVNPAEFARRYGALPPEKMVAHLERHGAAVTGVWLNEIPSEMIADAVQAEALKAGADLIVAGAFGHPRLWEKLMGGVTQDLLARMKLPILMTY
ncbi:MAG TPA: universal stress protein [Steroidobacteraceae bacterium]|jgi:nucleotide-binding universal stress UspA family protein